MLFTSGSQLYFLLYNKNRNLSVVLVCLRLDLAFLVLAAPHGGCITTPRLITTVLITAEGWLSFCLLLASVLFSVERTKELPLKHRF